MNHLSFVTNDGTLLVIGGAVKEGVPMDFTEYASEVEEYDPKTNAWTVIGTWGERDVWPRVGVRLADGAPLVVATGPSGTRAVVLQRSPFAWRRKATPSGLDHPLNGLLLDDGRAFFMNADARAFVYDDASNTWSTTPAVTMPTPVYSVAMSGGRAMVIDSNTDVPPEIWDPHFGTWSSVSPLPFAPVSAPIRLADGTIALLGVYHVAPASHLVPDYEFVPTALQLFDPATCAWTIAWTSRAMVRAAGVVLPDGKALFLDGYAPFDTADPAPPSASGIFDPSTSRWTMYDALPTYDVMPNVDVLPSREW